MVLTRKQYEDLNSELDYFYHYALKNMRREDSVLQENYSLGVYVGMAHILSLLGIPLERDQSGHVEINPSGVEIAGSTE